MDVVKAVLRTAYFAMIRNWCKKTLNSSQRAIHLQNKWLKKQASTADTIEKGERKDKERKHEKQK